MRQKGTDTLQYVFVSVRFSPLANVDNGISTLHARTYPPHIYISTYIRICQGPSGNTYVESTDEIQTLPRMVQLLHTRMYFALPVRLL